MIRRPVDAMLHHAAGRRSVHMPGHKGRAPFPCPDLYALDTTELPVTDNLWKPENAVLEAEALYAKAAGAACSLFLTGGSTAGIHAMLQLYTREGDTVLLPRNAHLSAINGCIHGGLNPAWIPARQTRDEALYTAETDVLAALDAHPEARALLLTRPDYFGGCIPIARIAEAAHARGIRLLVDEAHGAHFPWMETIRSAGFDGADAWVQSAHKTLPALTGCAALHLRDEKDRSRVLALLTREQSSSPSYLLVRAIDDARAWMDAYGKKRLGLTAAAVDDLRKRLPGMGLADAFARWKKTGYDFDPTRLVIDAPEGGFALEKALSEKGIDVEMADGRRVVMIFTAMDTPEDIAAIGDALALIPHEPLSHIPAASLCSLPETRMAPRAAVMAQTELVPLAEARGRVCAAAVGIYPPGIPLFVPGEGLEGEGLRLLTDTAPSRRFGTEGDKIECVL